MISLNKRLIFAFFLVLLISISACSGKKDVKTSLEEIRVGTEGIVINFLPNAPPEKVYVERDGESLPFDIVLKIDNKGAYPQPDEGTGGTAPQHGKVFLSGFDQNIIEIKAKDTNTEPKSSDLSKMALEGKSTINPNGGQDILSFTGTIRGDNLNAEKYEPTLLATACYHYETTAGPSVCIDPNPYSTVKERKVCEVQDITLSNQGAPIAVIKIDEEALAKKTQFKITIKNVGNGDALKDEAAENKCNPYGENIDQKISREDIDKVKLEHIKISETALDCGPFADTTEGSIKSSSGGFVRLVNGEGFVICELGYDAYSNKISAYTTPILIKLSYGYRTTVERKLLIKKETSSLGG